jgi:hypothetical protein
LQKCDNAGTETAQNRAEFNAMKTTYLKMQWLAPVLGVAVVSGGLMATRTYFELEHKVRAHEALTATLERLYQDQKLSTALKSMHEGDVEGAAQNLDALLCENILRLNDELASADARTRAYVEDVFRRIALARPELAGGGAAGSDQGRSDEQAAVERILRRALGNTHTAQVK